jgi:hypothetical protein
MALLLEAAELLEANTTHSHVLIVDTRLQTDAVTVVTFSDAAIKLGVNMQQLDAITKSHTLYQGRYFVLYQHADPLPCPAALLEPLQSSLKVRIVVDDDDEDADELKECIQPHRCNVIPAEDACARTSRKRCVGKKTRHGEIRKGKGIKAVKGNETIYFSSQASFGKFVNLKKGSISACLVKKPKKCVIRGWTLTRVPRSMISIVSV